MSGLRNLRSIYIDELIDNHDTFTSTQPLTKFDTRFNYNENDSIPQLLNFSVDIDFTCDSDKDSIYASISSSILSQKSDVWSNTSSIFHKCLLSIPILYFLFIAASRPAGSLSYLRRHRRE